MPRFGQILIALVFGVYLLHPALHLLEHHTSSEVAVEHCALCALDSAQVAQEAHKAAQIVDFLYEVSPCSAVALGVKSPSRSRDPPHPLV